MQNPDVGVIGCGFVGGAVSRAFSPYTNIKVYDKRPEFCSHSLKEVCSSDFVFICVPTPMSVDGSCDISILESVCQDICKAGVMEKTVFIHKSTVPVGTTTMLGKKYGLKLIFSPEFLTARHADIDFLMANRNILGGNPEWVEKVSALFQHRFPNRPIIRMTAEEAEAVKYTVNCFLATVVIFFNEIKLGLCDKYGLDYSRVLGQVMSDGRIGYSHAQVPGIDGDCGFGGSCFPKDLNSLICQMEQKGFDPKLLKACWQQNLVVRKHRDWEH
jgi:UDPglucose 6-dehydrogenase